MAPPIPTPSPISSRQSGVELSVACLRAARKYANYDLAPPRRKGAYLKKGGACMKWLGRILAILIAGAVSVLLVQCVVRKLYTGVGKRYVDVARHENA